MGKVYFPSFAPWWPDARDELLKFPYGTHDDFVDFLAWIGMGLTMQTPKAPRRARPETHARPGSLGWVKEQSRIERRAALNSGGW
jgi:hypothetical protein